MSSRRIDRMKLSTDERDSGSPYDGLVHVSSRSKDKRRDHAVSTEHRRRRESAPNESPVSHYKGLVDLKDNKSAKVTKDNEGQSKSISGNSRLGGLDCPSYIKTPKDQHIEAFELKRFQPLDEKTNPKLTAKSKSEALSVSRGNKDLPTTPNPRPSLRDRRRSLHNIRSHNDDKTRSPSSASTRNFYRSRSSRRVGNTDEHPSAAAAATVLSTRPARVAPGRTRSEVSTRRARSHPHSLDEQTPKPSDSFALVIPQDTAIDSDFSIPEGKAMNKAESDFLAMFDMAPGRKQRPSLNNTKLSLSGSSRSLSSAATSGGKGNRGSHRGSIDTEAKTVVSKLSLIQRRSSNKLQW